MLPDDRTQSYNYRAAEGGCRSARMSEEEQPGKWLPLWVNVGKEVKLER